jgi:hypothetical protein
MLWARLLAYVTGTVNQELLSRNEYLVAENRILRGQISGRLLLSDGEKVTLAEIARSHGSGGGGGNGQARYDSGLVSKAHRQEIKWLEITSKRRTLQDRSGNRTLGLANGEGES